ncbi:hsp70 family protein [Allorhodopirellula solitaria]|uniref:Chaperone protein DnaK n=1 Tax=Allorhodopirellula solitaria TaxID=2527987 RepID=A0A5C5WZS2_9BACT|nr:hsp70 family protein [Allorhodopirellula solitaria]TWT56414.1 Chaperone protein DnaK [Allorhodopirellula solitaria]
MTDPANPSVSDSPDAIPPRYCIGIDLGTTNCVVAFVDTESDQRSVEVFSVAQWVDVDTIESRSTLPSFHYTLTETETAAAEAAKANRGLAEFLIDPPNVRVGQYARAAGTSQPGRLIASAKSWLSHEGVDRTADLLPWHGDADVERRSPMAASAAYLGHLRAAWDDVFPEHPMAEQDVVVTLPASFDEVARELTVAAAGKAGLPRIQLIEEPQAAFYAWLDRHGDDWTQRVRVGQLILVCDIGGGTTDLTLIRVRPADSRAQSSNELLEDAGQTDPAPGDPAAGAVQFHRVAVGKHLILGGDNLDLAIAKAVEAKLDEPLPARRWQQLIADARRVKELMLSPDRPAETTVHLAGEGSSLIGDSLSLTVTAAEIDRVILEGFFPDVELESTVLSGQSGFQELGLPYAADPAITKHLAEFLRMHRTTGIDEGGGDSDRVDLVLFNGGVLRSSSIQSRVLGCLAAWFAGEQEDWKPEALQSPRLDLAVAQGAAYYARVRRGEGVRIAANLARTYFMQISQTPPRAVCVIPADAQPGQSYRIDSLPMELRVGVPVSFPLWASSTRLADRVGEVVAIDEKEMTPLPPIHTALQNRKKRDQSTMKIVIETQLSEIGTIGVYCVEDTAAEERSRPTSGRARRWKLEFDIRATLETDREAHHGGGEASGIVDEDTLLACQQEINAVFGSATEKPSKLVKRLQSSLEISRANWPPVLLRGIWESLMAVEPARRRSPAHESRWLNLLGYSLRPGYGVAVDDWRTAQTWRLLFGKIAHDDAQTRAETLILWRRIAGGLTAGQQSQLSSVLRKTLVGGAGSSTRIEAAETREGWRLVGSLEHLSVDEKRLWTRAALAQLERKKLRPLYPVLLWVIGRLATRIPTYGPLNLVIGSSQATGFLTRILASPALQTSAQEKSSESGLSEQIDKAAALALTQIARRCHDRFRDVDEDTRERVLRELRIIQAPAHFLRLVEEGGQFDHEEQAAIFGESLPLGIELR